MPHAGRTRNEIRPGYRSFPVGEYLIFYRVMEPGVRIMHVVHGRMDFGRYPFD
jgi:toxin ParE1/3/4